MGLTPLPAAPVTAPLDWPPAARVPDIVIVGIDT